MPVFEILFWGLIALCVVIALGAGFWSLSKYRAATGTIRNGIPAEATIESIAETGMTITSPSIGPEAAVFKMGLLVTPPGGGSSLPG